ncbi:hypothetical protein L1887_52038 [Cichorium endivia]|nr:hypothetical protein L1887_52038 [Cichorium endivia]
MPDGGMDSWDPTPVSNPIKAVAMRTSYHEPARGPDSSFEACQLQSPQRRALPIPVTPYNAQLCTSATAAIRKDVRYAERQLLSNAGHCAKRGVYGWRGTAFLAVGTLTRLSTEPWAGLDMCPHRHPRRHYH